MDTRSKEMQHIRSSVLFSLLDPQVRETIEKMQYDGDFLGHSDPTIMAFVCTLIMSNNITEVLELGTQIGFSAIAMGDALIKVWKHRGIQTSLDTVEPCKRLSDKAREYISAAGLVDVIHVYEGFSTDERIYSSLKTGYDLIYVDSSHSYDGTAKEIKIYWPYLMPSGIMIFHDSSEMASDFDPTKEGGVRRALVEWISQAPSDLMYSFLDPPVWGNPCGMFLAVKKSGRLPHVSRGPGFKQDLTDF